MSRRTAASVASRRTLAVAGHLRMSTQAGATNGSATPSDLEAPVLFESNGPLQRYILNRPKKLNALDTPMLDLLRPRIESWSKSALSPILVGSGVGRAFCAGGDVAGVVEAAANPATLPQAVDFFKREFELDYLLASVGKPYVVLMDGITMGGGVGLAAGASFRIATENTVFAMPETKIGYCPDVGASYFLSHLDGEIGTYLALTGDTVSGRDVFELGFATHYIPSRRIPALLERLASLENPSYEVISDTIEECSQERDPDEPPPSLIGAKRVALDTAFGHNTVEEIVASLKKISEENEAEDIRTWANATLTALDLRSPTSLKVALTAVRKGKDLDLKAALQMEMGIATAFCAAASPDFATGVTAVVGPKEKRVLGRPAWSPGTLDEVQDAYIEENFFSKFDPSPAKSPAAATPSDTPAVKAPTLAETIPYERQHGFMEFSLPTEKEIRQMVTGEHPSSGMTVITREELVKAFIFEYRGKMGVKEKVLEVASRCCVEEPDKETNNKWLRWKGPIA